MLRNITWLANEFANHFSFKDHAENCGRVFAIGSIRHLYPTENYSQAQVFLYACLVAKNAR